MGTAKQEKLLTASDLATLCEVDLKTIHNWVERGTIPHFRTPGRHLRFRPVDVASFLQTWGYRVPPELSGQALRPVLVVGGDALRDAVAGLPGLEPHFAVDLTEALVQLGAQPFQSLVVDAAALPPAEDEGALARGLAAVRRHDPAIACVVVGASASFGRRTASELEGVVEAAIADPIGLGEALGLTVARPATEPPASGVRVRPEAEGEAGEVLGPGGRLPRAGAGTRRR